MKLFAANLNKISEMANALGQLLLN
jgi:hypothetical protein